MPGWLRRALRCPTPRRCGRRRAEHPGGAGPHQGSGPVPRGDPPGCPGYGSRRQPLSGDPGREFHRCSTNACRIRGEEAAVLAARLKLADTVRAVIANCLALIGVAAPEKM
ncbi:MAG: DALR anticodon-binding domain-containing protein [Flavonifractor plautii]